jgi:hypothetical protein
MKRKLVFLPNIYSKHVVDVINEYFDIGYDIEDIFDAVDGRYILLVIHGDEKYMYKRVDKINSNCDKKYDLIEDMCVTTCWNSTNTKDVEIN